jgi:hypothetical protein
MMGHETHRAGSLQRRRAGHPFRSKAVRVYERPLALTTPALAPHRPWAGLALGCLLLLLGTLALLKGWR